MRPTFRALFDAQAAYVLGRLRWLGIPERDRPDVAQEIFVDVARHLEDLDPDRPVRPWLLTITCNAARDYWRRASVRREQLVAGELDALATAKEDRVHDQLHAATVVRRLLASLQYDHREVLMLVALDERPVPEVAELLALPVKTVESRLARARERLAEAFARLRAAEQHRLGPGAALSVTMLGDVDELLRASRDVDEDLHLEVEDLRARMTRAFHAPSPAPAAAAASPVATFVGLAFFGAVAVAACVHGFTAPPPASLAMCPVLEAAAVPASSPAAPPVPTIITAAIASTAPSSSTSTSPAPAPSPCARASSTTSPAPAEMSELELLGMARRALREGSTVRAVAWLRRHERTYPHGSLAGERTAMLARLAGSR